MIAGTGISLGSTGTEVTINSQSTTTASNLGTGEDIFATKVGSDLRFKTLIAGTGISLGSTGTEVTITNDNTLQETYDSSSPPVIDYSNTEGGLVLRDSATPYTGSLLKVQNNGGTVDYMDLSTTNFNLLNMQHFMTTQTGNFTAKQTILIDLNTLGDSAFIEAYVHGNRQAVGSTIGASGDSSMWKGIVSAKNSGAVILSNQISVFGTSDFPGALPTFNVAGTVVRLRVTGDLNMNIHYDIHVRIMNLSESV